MNELLKRLFEVGDYRNILKSFKSYEIDNYYSDLIKCYTLLFLDDFKGARIIASKYENDLNFLLVEAYINYAQMKNEISLGLVKKIIESNNVINYIKLESYIIAINCLTENIKMMENLYNEALNYALYENLFIYKSIIDFVYHRTIASILADDNAKRIVLRTEFELENYGNLNYYFYNVLYNVSDLISEYRFNEAEKKLRIANSIALKVGSLSMLSRLFLVKHFFNYSKGDLIYEDLIKAYEYANLSQNYINLTLAMSYLISYYEFIKDYENRNKILLEYEKLIKENNIKKGISRFLFSKAIVLSGEGKYEESLKIIEEAYNLSNSKYQKSSIEIFKCALLFKMNRIEEAYNLFLKLLEDGSIIYQAFEKEIMELISPLFDLYIQRNEKLNENFIKLMIKTGYEDKLKIEDIYNYMDESELLKRIDKIKDKNIIKKLKDKLKYEIYLFGKLRIKILDKTIYEENFDRPITAKVFKFFLINRNKFLSKEMIFEELWPKDDPKKASAKLHTIVSNIRKILINDEVIISSGGNYGFFTNEKFYIDIDDFEKSIKYAIAISYKNVEEAISKIIHAFNLYTADLLEGDLYEEWIFVERERLKQILSQGILLLSDLLLKKNLDSLAIAYLESSLFRNVESKTFKKLMDILKLKNLEDRIEFWNNYVERVLK
jgi:DNA-binding SARP family transcriptional activator